MASRGLTGWVRSVLAVVAGFLVIVVLSVGIDTLLEQTILPGLARAEASTGVWLFVTFYRAAVSIGGCFVAAWLAPRRPMGHAIALGILGIVVSTAGLVAMWGVGPMWYPIALIVMALPCAWIGGKLYETRLAAAT
jgi:hypothetical protein